MDIAKGESGTLRKSLLLETENDPRNSIDVPLVNSIVQPVSNIPVSAPASPASPTPTPTPTPTAASAAAAAAVLAVSTIMNGMVDSDEDRSLPGPLMSSRKYDSENSDSEENNLSFEQLKNELIVLKRKKKELKITQVNENQVLNSTPSLLGYAEASGPGYGFGSGIVGGEPSPEDSVDHWRVMGLLEASKKRAKTVVEMFLPSVFGLRRLLRVHAVLCCAVLCGVLCGVVWCGVLCCVVWCGVVWCGVVWCAVMCAALWCCVLCGALCCAMLCCAVVCFVLLSFFSQARIIVPYSFVSFLSPIF